jgi:hypothetical protein
VLFFCFLSPQDIERMKRELETVAARLMRSQMQREVKNNDYESNLREAERELDMERRTRAKLEAKLDALKARAAVGALNTSNFDEVMESAVANLPAEVKRAPTHGNSFASVCNFCQTLSF